MVDVFDGGMHSLATVQAMLVGMALECLLEGNVDQEAQSLEEHTVLGLTFGGKKPKVPNGKGRICRRSRTRCRSPDAAGVSLRQGERAVLQRLSGFIKWGGRYPIPTTADQMKPSSTGGGPQSLKLRLRSRTQARSEDLARRLMTRRLNRGGPSELECEADSGSGRAHVRLQSTRFSRQPARAAIVAEGTARNASWPGVLKNSDGRRWSCSSTMSQCSTAIADDMLRGGADRERSSSSGTAAQISGEFSSAAVSLIGQSKNIRPFDPASVQTDTSVAECT